MSHRSIQPQTAVIVTYISMCIKKLVGVSALAYARHSTSTATREGCKSNRHSGLCLPVRDFVEKPTKAARAISFHDNVAYRFVIGCTGMRVAPNPHTKPEDGCRRSLQPGRT